MVWAKIDDKYAEHPKVIAAGEDAAWINVKAILWSCRFLTDGFIPADTATALAGGKPSKATAALIERLTRGFHGRSGLWKTAPGGYLIHDFLEYNPSKEAVEAERKASRQRQARFRERHSGRFSNGGETEDSQRYDHRDNAVTNGSVTPTPSRPVPARPVPSPTLSPTPPPGPTPGEKGGNGNGGGATGLWTEIRSRLLSRLNPAPEARLRLDQVREVGGEVGEVLLQVPNRLTQMQLTSSDYTEVIEEALEELRPNEPTGWVVEVRP